MTIFLNVMTTNNTPRLLPDAAILPIQTSNATRSLNINTHQIGDMILVYTGNRSTSAPALLAGYTDIIALNDTTQSRQIRLQYKFATQATEQISWVGAYGHMLAIRNATGILDSKVQVLQGSSNVVPAPDTTVLNPSGKSLVIVGSFYNATVTGVTSPYTGFRNALGFVEKNSSSSQTSINITHSTSNLARSSYLVEII